MPRVLRRALGQAIEFLDLGEADVDLRALLFAACADQLRQPVQGLRAEHQVDERRTLDDRFAFLRGDAAADADDDFAALVLQALPHAQLAEHLLLRLLADGAGVDQMTSASSGLSVSSRPSLAASTSAILAESYSFIWQPWVLMYSLPFTWSGLRGPAGRATSGYRPVWWAERRLASRSWRLIHSGGGKAGNSTRIPRQPPRQPSPCPAWPSL